MKMKHKKLFEQFPPVTTNEWIDKIKSDLRGSDYYDKLVWKTDEGFDVLPFYRKDDVEKLNYINDFLPLLLKSDGTIKSTGGENKTTIEKILPDSWLIRQNIKVGDYGAANIKALDILMKGVDSVGFIIEDPESLDQGNFEVLLNEIIPEGTEINFYSTGKAKEIISFLLDLSDKRGADRSTLRGAVEADPLGRFMVNGTLCIPVSEGFDYLASLTSDCASLPQYRNIQVNSTIFTQAGAGLAVELALALSAGVEYLHQLTERGINAELAASKIRFSFGIGPGYFMEIARLRAARILWSLVAKAFNGNDNGSFRMEIHCITKTGDIRDPDPYTGMLQTQTEAMSAVLGGADSVTVEPVYIPGRQSEEFSERIARNQQLILKEEAWFNKVADPSAGSYYIENLTEMIAEKSWNLFIETEKEGGFLSALGSGFINRKINDSYGKRKRDDL